VTATAAANGRQQRPAATHNTRTIRANSGYARPEKRKVVRQRRTTENLAYASVRFRYLAGGGLLGRAERPENSADFHPCRVMNSARRTGAMVSDAHTERGSDQIRPDGGTMILGTTLGIIYIVLLVVFGILCFRKGHWVLGLIGIIFPILWIIGAILPSRYVRR
jgi:hypothetical protein